MYGSRTIFVEVDFHPSNPAIYRGGNRSSVSPALAMTDQHVLHCGLKPKDGSDSVSPRYPRYIAGAGLEGLFSYSPQKLPENRKNLYEEERKTAEDTMYGVRF